MLRLTLYAGALIMALSGFAGELADAVFTVGALTAAPGAVYFLWPRRQPDQG